jgi:cytochrome P450
MLLMARDEETGESLDDQAVRDEAMTLFLAGHETTALATAWACFLLSRNPSHFRRLREEGEPYALRVMKEALRIYPPAHIIGRSALRDTRIGDFAIRKGEVVLVSPWLIHRNPKYFADPLVFDPDRFLPEREASIPRFAYFPFGGGRRVCIGNQFALMEGKIILYGVAQRFYMEPLSQREPGYAPLLTLRPKRAIILRLRAIAR